MMDHEFYIDRLSAYFDGELKHEEEFMVEEHIKDCPECQKVLADLRKFDEMVAEHSELGDDEYWEKSAQKIEAAISGEKTTKVVDVKPKTKSIWMSWKAIGSLATAAVLIFIAVNYVDIRKNVEKQTDSKASAPAIQDSTTVDQLLEKAGSVKKAVTDSGKGEVFIRGGRAGETNYIVDGAPIEADDADRSVGQESIAEEKKKTVPAEPSPPAETSPQEKTKETIVQKVKIAPTKTTSKPIDKRLDKIFSSDDYKSDLSQSIEVKGAFSDEKQDESPDTLYDEQELGFAGPELTLEQWRAKADSLSDKLDEIKKRNKYRAGLSNKYDVTSDDVNEALIVDQYLDCYYQIGSKTEMKEEYLKAVMIIKSYQEGFSETVGIKATQTLDKLLALKRFKEE